MLCGPLEFGGNLVQHDIGQAINTDQGPGQDVIDRIFRRQVCAAVEAMRTEGVLERLADSGQRGAFASEQVAGGTYPVFRFQVASMR